MQGHRPAPHTADVLEHLARPIHVNATAIGHVIVFELQGAVIVQPRHRDVRRAEVVLGRKQRLVQAMQVAIHAP